MTVGVQHDRALRAAEVSAQSANPEMSDREFPSGRHRIDPEDLRRRRDVGSPDPAQRQRK
jgi:hypothetical protein